MLPYKTLILIDKKSSIAYYKQIAAQLVSYIQKGLLQSGVFLPSSREMAATLDIHRNTVIAAYEEMATQNWIETVPGKGTRISLNLPLIIPRSFSENAEKHKPYAGQGHFSFSKEYINLIPDQLINDAALTVNDGFPDIDLAPVEYIIKEYRKQLNGNNLKKSAAASGPAGSKLFKSATCKFLNESRGLSVSEENILPTRGAQMAIFLAASLLIKPGDLVMVSDPNYFIADAVFTSLGAKLI
ncbi:MAG: aminotransferase class I/II-fold pyridoxal phosphate-dependent enzyme, partial [Dyadobacter sp.]